MVWVSQSHLERLVALKEVRSWDKGTGSSRVLAARVAGAAGGSEGYSGAYGSGVPSGSPDSIHF